MQDFTGFNKNKIYGDKSMNQSAALPSIQITERRANKKTKFFIGGIMIALAVVYLIYMGIQSNATYFFTVDELFAKGATMQNQAVRVSGMVDANTIKFNNQDLILVFDVVSATGKRMPVIFNGPRPDQMREGSEAIVEGKYDGQTFKAQNLLLKCPSKYEGEPEQVQVQAIK